MKDVIKITQKSRFEKIENAAETHAETKIKTMNRIEENLNSKSQVATRFIIKKSDPNNNPIIKNEIQLLNVKLKTSEISSEMLEFMIKPRIISPIKSAIPNKTNSETNAPMIEKLLWKRKFFPC